jgi:hypothetical protein
MGKKIDDSQKESMTISVTRDSRHACPVLPVVIPSKARDLGVCSTSEKTPGFLVASLVGMTEELRVPGGDNFQRALL